MLSKNCKVHYDGKFSSLGKDTYILLIQKVLGKILTFMVVAVRQHTCHSCKKHEILQQWLYESMKSLLVFNVQKLPCPQNTRLGKEDKLITLQSNKGKVGGICWSSTWPQCSSPWHLPLSLWREEPITMGHRARVTAGLPQFTFCESEVTTPSLILRTYSLLGEQGAWGYRKKRPNFSTHPGVRTRDLSVVSRVCYRCTRVPITIK